jgi:hypothetical protein
MAGDRRGGEKLSWAAVYVPAISTVNGYLHSARDTRAELRLPKAQEGLHQVIWGKSDFWASSKIDTGYYVVGANVKDIGRVSIVVACYVCRPYLDRSGDAGFVAYSMIKCSRSFPRHDDFCPHELILSEVGIY